MEAKSTGITLLKSGLDELTGEFTFDDSEIIKDVDIYLEKYRYHGMEDNMPINAIFYIYADDEVIAIPMLFYTSEMKASEDDFDEMVEYSLTRNTSNQSSNVQKGQPQSFSNTSGIRPEVKELLDSYEAFMDEYVEFMENYDSSDISALLKYTEFMSKYADFAEKVEALDDTDLTDEEALYYAEVSLRVSQKMLKVAGSMSN